MKESLAGTLHAGEAEQKLPWRDWILLPTIAIATIVVLFATTETVARMAFPAWHSSPSCYILNGGRNPRPTPNCVYTLKIPESEPAIYHLNSCGHRTEIDCAHKAPGTYRIAVIGSSVVVGAPVSEQNAFVHLLAAKFPEPGEGKRIEFYNASLGPGAGPHWQAEHFAQVLAVKPDMILWPITPNDVESEHSAAAPPAYPGPLGVTRYRLMQAWKARSIDQASRAVSEALGANLRGTSTATMLEHFLYLSPTEYQRVVIADGLEHGFLRASFDAAWQSRLRMFAEDVAAIEQKTQRSGIPLVAVLLPDRGQAAMLSMGAWPDGWNPYELDNQMRRIVTSQGGIYLDILPPFQRIPDAAKDFFPVDDHPNEEGHKLLATLLARALADSSLAIFRGLNHHAVVSELRQ